MEKTDLQRQIEPTTDLGTAIHMLFKPLGGVELEIPPREPAREPPDFSQEAYEHA